MVRYKTDSLFESEQSEQISAKHIIRVAFESGVDNEFDYFLPDEFWPVKVGQRVEAPFGRKDKPQRGFCVKADIPAEDSFISRGMGRKLKVVSAVIDKEPLIDDNLMELARWISTYYVCPLGQVLAAMVPSAVKEAIGLKIQKYVYLGIKAACTENKIKEISGRKQKKIVKYLQKNQAFGLENASKLDDLLSAIPCTYAPVKKLVEKQIVKIIERTVLPSLPAIPETMTIKTDKVILNDDQQKALVHFNDQINSAGFGVTLLHGVNDSGKTELYIKAIEIALKKSKSAIVLLPEIALTAQTVQRFNNRFEKIAVMHSALTATERNVQWQKVRKGQADVVIGARSAIFAPLLDIGLIVVDEEHEPSYKQDTVPRYHARDVAIKRAQLSNAHCILGSATPSLETILNCRTKKYFHLVRLPKRVKSLPMPEMKLVDLRQQHSTRDGMTLISKPLDDYIKTVLAKNEQAILLLNRRGYSNFVFCPSCKHTLHCRNCDVTLTFHKSKIHGTDRVKTITGKHMNYGYALCHYCSAQTLVPVQCPLCGKGMAMIGLGSQKLEEELVRKFPAARISRIDSDSMAHSDYYRLLKDFSDGLIDILAGTQILAKGLHFPNVTLVGIISADTCLYIPDFRSNERTFQLISQVAGRTGRSEKEGIVFVQTFLPNQPAIKFALNTDFQGFIKQELSTRKACNLPPFWRLAAVIMRDRDFEKLDAASKIIRERIDSIVESYKLKVKVRGPMSATISRIQRFHRMQIIIQAPQPATMQQLFTHLRKAGPLSPVVKVAIDIDPVNLL